MAKKSYDEDDGDDSDDDEGPSRADQERFSREETSRCGECGHEVHALADICPKCHAFLWEDRDDKKPIRHRRWRGIFILLTILVILAMSGLLGLFLR